VIARLNGEIVRALKQQDVREKLAAAGADALGTSPDELAAFIRSESRKFAELIKVSGAKLD
jgi:tripartite-type tricarboxylate transporter receptor subunit TctC